MTRVVFLLGLMLALTIGAAARAQDQVWVQIEAQPTLREAEERAQAYTGAFSDVTGFRLRSGWYGIMLGPYTPAEAARKLEELKRERLIPADSFVNDGANLRRRFWPAGDTGPTVAPVEESPLPDTGAAPAETAQTEPLVEPLPEPLPEPATEPALPDETPEQARAAEAALGQADREALQTALQWFGFYDAAVDGAFGPGTRKSMAAWQEANGADPTGILTTAQRGALLAAYGQAQAELGLETITEAEAGIEITLPMALVEFDHYEPPFVHFKERNGSGVTVILISEPGDQGTLYGLYDTLQTLAVVPMEGERDRQERSFTIRGRSAGLESHTYAELSKGLIKGYMLVWNPQDGDRMARVLAAMQKSFRPVGERALDPGLVPMPDEARAGLLSGLEVRRPARSRTGFYVDATGAVLTTTEATEGCGRITIDGAQEADVALADPTLGIAVLKPKRPLAPAAVAELQTAPARPGGEVAVAGYSYEDRLPAPVLTFGRLQDTKGLDGEPDLNLLAIEALPGDAGGPVFDSAGAVLGMLMPRADSATRRLPDEVNHAANAAALSAALARAGITPAASARSGALAPEDLSDLAEGMTVLVSCWN